MDPIHPIIPGEPRIPPVTQTPRYGRISEEQRRERQRREQDAEEAEQEMARRRPQRRPEEGEDESGPHIDVTA